MFSFSDFSNGVCFDGVDAFVDGLDEIFLITTDELCMTKIGQRTAEKEEKSNIPM